LNRVKRAPWLVIGLWLATVVVALPFAIMLQALIGDHLGASLAAQSAADSVNYDWWNEFLAQTSGVGLSFVPAILGFAAVMKNLSTVADGASLPTTVAVAVSAHMVVSLFLIGGVMDRLARDRAIGAGAFFSACGVYAVRFFRLAIIATAVYWVLFVPYHEMLFDGLYPALIEGVTLERTAFFYRAGLYLLFLAPLLLANLIFDYAKVRAVVEDRRSMIGALVAGLRFVGRNPGAAIGLYALDALLFVAVIGGYFLAAPGANHNALGFAVGQIYIVLRVIVRLQFAASQIALFQGRLAHAGYVARPVPKWPDSPAAEALGPQIEHRLHTD
jgi:preprotein translocase subunit SecG